MTQTFHSKEQRLLNELRLKLKECKTLQAELNSMNVALHFYGPLTSYAYLPEEVKGSINTRINLN